MKIGEMSFGNNVESNKRSRMKLFVLLGVCSLLLLSCNKDKKTFTLKTVKLNSYTQSKHSAQNLFVKVVDENGTVLNITDNYPGSFTLPATFAIDPTLKLKLYKNQYAVQLWGDSIGLIGSSEINMDEYKIIFPIDMETKSEDVSFNVAGSWR